MIRLSIYVLLKCVLPYMYLCTWESVCSFLVAVQSCAEVVVHVALVQPPSANTRRTATTSPSLRVFCMVGKVG